MPSQPAPMHTPETPLPWFPCHPFGGREIYKDGNTHAPMATFTSPNDCAFAIHAVNHHAALLAALQRWVNAHERLMAAGPDATAEDFEEEFQASQSARAVLSAAQANEREGL